MVLQNGAKVTDTKALAAELYCRFYALGWFSVVGGSIAIKVHDESVPKPAQLIIMAPTGIYSLYFYYLFINITLINTHSHIYFA